MLQLNDVSSVTPQTIPLRLLLVTVIHIVVFNIVFVVRKYLLPVNRGGMQWLKAVALILSAGLLRGYFIAEFGQQIGILPNDDIAYRMLLSMQNTSLMFALCAYVTVAAKDWGERRSSLEVQNLRLQELLAKSLHQINEAHQRVIATVTGQLYRFVHDLEKVKPEDLVDSLRNGVANIVRPLSREVLAEANVAKPIDVPRERVSLLGTIRNIQSPKGLDALLIPAMLAYVSLPYGLRLAGPVSALIANSIIILVGGAYLWLWQNLERIANFKKPSMVWLSLIARVTSFAFFLAWLITISVPKHILPSWRLVAYLVLFSMVAQIAYALAKSAERRLQDIEQELRAVQARLEWENSRVTEVQRQQARALSIAIHGPVQTAVGAAIIRLERALQSGPISQELVDEVTKLIWESLDNLGNQPESSDLNKVFEDLRETWHDVCQIKISMPDFVRHEVAKDVVATQLLADTIPELVFNAIKHGGASEVSVEIFEPDDDSMAFQVRNNGAPFTDSGKRGLGLKYLDDAALSVLNFTEDGENLTLVVVPFEATDAVSPPPGFSRTRVNPYLDALSNIGVID
ncbi:MAG: hypothetical protein RL508_180 [Actinomycetota bacterium]|jgi:signal transduction histidine kinase